MLAPHRADYMHIFQYEPRYLKFNKGQNLKIADFQGADCRLSGSWLSKIQEAKFPIFIDYMLGTSQNYEHPRLTNRPNWKLQGNEAGKRVHVEF